MSKERHKSYKFTGNGLNHAGIPDYCELYVGAEGHRYYKDGVWPFVRKHFKNE